MEIEVRYISRGGNTKKVADAIAKAAGVEAKDCGTPIENPVDLLFIGSALYGFTLDEGMIAYINGLDAGKIKAAAVFGTSAILKSGNKKMVNLLKKKGIHVVKDNFHCFGEYLKTRVGHPNENDLALAAEFVKNTIASLK